MAARGCDVMKGLLLEGNPKNLCVGGIVGGATAAGMGESSVSSRSDDIQCGVSSNPF